jgi:hypothetical protein
MLIMKSPMMPWRICELSASLCRLNREFWIAFSVSDARPERDPLSGTHVSYLSYTNMKVS